MCLVGNRRRNHNQQGKGQSKCWIFRHIWNQRSEIGNEESLVNLIATGIGLKEEDAIKFLQNKWRLALHKEIEKQWEAWRDKQYMLFSFFSFVFVNYASVEELFSEQNFKPMRKMWRNPAYIRHCNNYSIWFSE